ncbi:MAG: chemotaxis protein CheA [Firmicutes bacterium]|nr:chemotaxis protein CheA [Bacillota bacterium]
MLEMFIFETAQLLEQLEQIIINSEKSKSYSTQNINEIFRIMHTIKGSSAMMLYDDISILAHSMEDLFYFVREKKPLAMDFSELTDLILDGADFIKTELSKIEGDGKADGKSNELIENIKKFLSTLKEKNSLEDEVCITKEKLLPIKEQKYYIGSGALSGTPTKKILKATIYFEEGCQMENVRAFSIIHNFKGIADDISYYPSDIIENDETEEVIRKDGFCIYLKTEYSADTIREILMQTVFLRHLELEEVDEVDEAIQRQKSKEIVLEGPLPSTVEEKMAEKVQTIEAQTHSLNQNIISVNVSRLDKLMDLVGEMVIAEAMVVQNPDLKELELDNFDKAARQLNKITGEIQDIVMAIRMVPLSGTFHKMNRIVRDMSKKLNKEVELTIIGEKIEVDKNIIEHISDPLMHLMRNTLDHGIETTEKRLAKGKTSIGTIILEAKNVGSDVMIIIKDDGKGLDKEKILKKAKENGLLYKAEGDMTDKEIYNLIFLPGFSTKDSVTEYSGRGVGMDVVTRNIETIGGTVSVDSFLDKGTIVTLKIPLTLAIIDGMNIKVGKSCYTIPTVSIKESFRPLERDIIVEPNGNEMIMVRGQCYPILRLHELYGVNTEITGFMDGIFVMVEQDEKSLCIFADELLGQQQVVVKLLPNYITNFKKINGLAGCTLLGDGSISLILDIAGLVNI